MKNLLFLFLIASFLSSCNSVSGSGEIVTSNRSVPDFTGVSAAEGIKVEVKTGDVFKVLVEADDNLVEEIETKVEGGTLRIRMKEHMNVRNGHLKVFVTAPSIKRLSSSSAADIKVVGGLSDDEAIKLDASSGSSIKADLDAPVVSAESSSGAGIELSGRTRNFTASSSSGAKIDAGGLMSENTVAETSSGASVNAHASVRLEAKASSGGTVKYRGAATVIKKESSGGNIEKVN